jgi:branched-chain amino acid transport system ATP-binding protein
VKQVMHAIRKLADVGFPVLLVEQNIKQVLQFSHRAYVLENGRLVLDGPSSELQGHPMIKKAYLGL